MKRTILLSVMVFLLLIWKGNAQVEKKLEPDIPSKPATYELLFLPSVLNFDATTIIELPIQEEKTGFHSNLHAPLVMLIFNKVRPLSTIKLRSTLSDTQLYDFYKPDLFKQIC